MSTNNYEGLFTDAVEGLKEFYPILGDVTVVDDLRIVVAEHFKETDGGQADYEVLRDRIEKVVNVDEDTVREDLRNSVRRMQNDGHARPKGKSLRM